jgi:putative MATE family efflux protein
VTVPPAPMPIVRLPLLVLESYGNVSAPCESGLAVAYQHLTNRCELTTRSVAEKKDRVLRISQFTRDPVLRGLLALSLPMTLVNLVQQSYLIADSVIVGHYVGVLGLAAVGGAQPVYYLVSSVFLGLLNGFTIRIAALTGKGEDRTRQAVILALGAFVLGWSVLCVVLVMFGAGGILAMIGISRRTATESVAYLHTLGIGLLPIFSLGALTALFRGMGQPRLIMSVLAGSSLLNVVLAWVFVGACGMGVRGAALGTVCASTISSVAGLILATRRYSVHQYRVQWPLCLTQLTGSLRLGFPMGIQFAFLSIGNFVLTSLVVPFGPAALAGISIAARLETVTSRIFLDLSGAMTVLVAQSRGAGEVATIRRAVRLSLFCCLCATLAIVLSIIAMRGYIGGMFTTSRDVIAILNLYILMTYPFFPLFTLMAVAHGFLNGLGRTTIPLLCTVVSYVAARVPAAMLLREHLGLAGIIWAVDIGWFVGAAFTAWVVTLQLREHHLSESIQRALV